MEFYIEKHSSGSVVRQIQEQIKLAVTMGVFRRGDTLPSIRDVEKQTGVNRGLVHKAYLGLRKSGLLTLARGKGTVISTDAPSPPPVTETCRQLSIETIAKARQTGISPIAFARYISLRAQEDERNAPFIAYVDGHREDSVQRAEQISQAWQVPVVGLTVDELKSAIRDGFKPQKILANYFLQDRLKSVLRGKKLEIIPIAIRGTEQTDKALARIKANSSVLLIMPTEVYAHASFIVAQLPKLLSSRGIEISHASAESIGSFEELLKDLQYDLYIVGYGVHRRVPPKLRSNPRFLFLNMELDPASVEAARIRAGVVI